MRPQAPIIEQLEPRLLLSTVTDIAAVAATGTPADETIASANIRQAIIVNGSDFDASTEVSFPTISSDGTRSTRAVSPTRAADDGSSLEVVVPDSALTGEVTVVGADGFAALQVVPIIEDIDLLSSEFGEGSSFRILGSGFTLTCLPQLRRVRSA